MLLAFSTGFLTVSAAFFSGTASAQPLAPVLAENGAVNAASLERTFCPGCRILIHGQNLAPSSAAVTAETTVDGLLPSTLAGTTVTIGELAVPLLSVTPQAIEAVIPWETSLGAATLTVTTAEGQASGNIEIQSHAPAFYPGLRDNAGNPVSIVRPLDIVTALVNGLGPAESSIPSAQWPMGVPVRDAASLRLTFATTAAEILSATLTAPGQYTVQFRVPFLGPGEWPLTMQVGGVSSPEIPVPFDRHPGATLTVSANTISLTVVERASAAEQLRIGSGVAGVPLRVAATTVSGGPWLSGGLSASTTPAVLTISVNAANLAPGTYSGEVRISSDAVETAPTIPVTAVVTRSLSPRITGISPDPIPSGRVMSFFAVFGSNMDSVSSIEIQPGGIRNAVVPANRSRGVAQTVIELPAVSAAETRQLRVTSANGVSESFPVRLVPVANGPTPRILSISPAEFLSGTTIRPFVNGENLAGRLEVTPSTGITLTPDGFLEIAATAAPGLRTLRMVLSNGSATDGIPIFVRKPEPELTSVRPLVLLQGRRYYTADAVSPASLSFSGLDLNNRTAVSITPPQGITITTDDKVVLNSVVSLSSSQAQSVVAVAPNAATGNRTISLRTQGGPTNSLPIEVRPPSDRSPVLDRVSVETVSAMANGFVVAVVRITYRDPDGDVRLAGSTGRSGLFCSPHPVLSVSKLAPNGGFRDLGSNSVEIRASIAPSPFGVQAITNPKLTFWLADEAGNLSNAFELDYTGQWPTSFATPF